MDSHSAPPANHRSQGGSQHPRGKDLTYLAGCGGALGILPLCPEPTAAASEMTQSPEPPAKGAMHVTAGQSFSLSLQEQGMRSFSGSATAPPATVHSQWLQTRFVWSWGRKTRLLATVTLTCRTSRLFFSFHRSRQLVRGSEESRPVDGDSASEAGLPQGEAGAAMAPGASRPSWVASTPGGPTAC